MFSQKFLRAFNRIAEAFACVRVCRTQTADNLSVIGEKERAFMQLSGHAPFSRCRAPIPNPLA
jgi:hypothetical protein